MNVKSLPWELYAAHSTQPHLGGSHEGPVQTEANVTGKEQLEMYGTSLQTTMSGVRFDV